MSSKKIKKLKIKNNGVQYELDFNLPQASDIDLGLTKLSDDVDSTSNVKDGVSATPLAVKTVNEKVELLKLSLDDVAFVESVEEIPDDMETNKFYLETSDSNNETLNFFVENASLTTRGITQLTNVVDYNQELAITPFGVKNALDAIKTNSLSYIIQPKITTPINESTNQPAFPTIVGSPYRSLLPEDLREKRIFQISESNTFETLAQEHEVQDDNFTVQTQLKGQTKYYFRIKDVSQSGQESVWSKTVSITTGDAIQVNVPIITLKGFNNSPTDILSGVIVECSEFGVEEGYSDTHISTDWYITLANGRSNVWQSLNDTVNKTSITIPEGTFEKSTTYRLFVVYRGLKYGDSAVAYIDFTTSDDFGTVSKPILEVEGAPSNVFETPLLSGGIFSNTRDPDVHVMSDWEIYPQGGGEFVFQSISDKINKTSITIPKGFLQVNTAYKARARYKGQKYGWSEWSEVVFNTVDAFASVATPTISSQEGTTDVQADNLFYGSSFVMEEGEGSHDKTDWILVKTEEPNVEIWSSKNDVINKTECPDLSDVLVENTSYTLKVRYHDANNDLWSNFGLLSFTTASIFIGIVTPIINVQITSDQNVDYSSEFISTEFKCTGTTDVCQYVEWILYKDGFEVWSMKKSKPLFLLGSFAGYTLEAETDYTLTCRHYAQKLRKWSKLGSLNFRTIEALQIPSIKLKMKNSVRISNILAWWNSDLKVYKNGEYDENMTINYNKEQTLSEDGDVIEIKNQIQNNLPNLNLKNNANLISIEAPLPTLRMSDNGAFVTNLGSNGGVGGTGNASVGGSTGYGAFYNCSSLKSLPEKLFKNNPQITNFGGIGGKGGSGSLNHGGQGGTAYGVFALCKALEIVPSDIFNYNELAKDFGKQGEKGGGNYGGRGGIGYGPFFNCSSLVVDLVITNKNIKSVDYFANGTKEIGTVRVPSGSTTATTFKNSNTANVNVIEEN